MILRDEDIKEYGDELIDEGYNEKCVESISYRITINGIITKDKEGRKETKSEYTLRSLDTVYVKSNEHIKLLYISTGVNHLHDVLEPDSRKVRTTFTEW